jgi:asparagine synthase (glutamine-hydrolysing)
VVEFCCRLPPEVKLFGLNEKYLLRRLARKWLPDEIWQRRKRPYRAPIHRSFFGPEGELEYVRELLSEKCLRASGLFNPAAVQQMVHKLQAGKRLGETDDMALAGILSTQLVWKQFVEDFRSHMPPPARPEELTKECTRPIL